MADTFNNDLRVREQEAGSNSGTWGGLLNTTISNLASAFGQGSEAIPNASTHTITLADGAADEARSMYLKCTGGGQACTVTLAPNTISKVWIISNETSFTLTFSQGSGANVAVAAGAVKMIVTDGAGATGAVTDVLSGLALSNLDATGTIKLDGNYPTGTNNVAVGDTALDSITSDAQYNVAIGSAAGTAVTTGIQNTLIGGLAGDSLTTGSNNTAVGRDALGADTLGSRAVAIGDAALQSLNFTTATEHYNVAVGYAAGANVTTGTKNTLIGGNSGDALTAAGFNVGVGNGSLSSDTLGSHSVALGHFALRSQNHTTATDAHNVAVGSQAGTSVTTGVRNTLIGGLAGDALTDADRNVAIGFQALTTDTLGSRSVAIGHNALSVQNFTTATDSYNTAVGHEAGASVTSATGSTLIGALAGDALTQGARNVAVGTAALTNDTLGQYAVAIGYGALSVQNFTTATNNYNIGIGYLAGENVTTGVGNTFLGGLAGTSSTGSGVDNNTFIGFQAGRYVTSGEKNTVLGRYDGNQGSLDIRTTHNNIVISDGDGNPRAYYDGGSSYPLWHFVTPTSGQNSINLSHSSASSPYGPAIRFTAVDPNNTTQYFLVGIGNVTARFIVFSNGDVANINNSYGAYSDVKLKENIIDASSQWDDIKALSVRKYSLKQDNLDAPNMLGVIAQEVEAAGVGGLVYESPDKDSENNDLGTVTKQVKYSVLYMKAVKALQEAMERIETLEAKVAALEA